MVSCKCNKMVINANINRKRTVFVRTHFDLRNVASAGQSCKGGSILNRMRVSKIDMGKDKNKK